MNEPFRRSSREEKVFYEGKPIPIFSASRFSSCDWNHYVGIVKPLPVTDELSDIFDMGNEVHREEEYLRLGARNILECEEYMRIVHTSERWGVAGLLDYDKLSFRGAYLEDLKSTKWGGFFFFLREGMKHEDKRQMSIYAYMKYVHTGTKRTRGVITKIDKEEPLNRMSLVADLIPINEIRTFLTKHPVKRVILGEITEKEFIDSCIGKMASEVNQKTGEHWRCGNCQYANGTCPVRQAI